MVKKAKTKAKPKKKVQKKRAPKKAKADTTDLAETMPGELKKALEFAEETKLKLWAKELDEEFRIYIYEVKKKEVNPSFLKRLWNKIRGKHET